MITALYASILAALMIWLSIQVIKQRRSAKVAYADGGVNALYPDHFVLNGDG